MKQKEPGRGTCRTRSPTPAHQIQIPHPHHHREQLAPKKRRDLKSITNGKTGCVARLGFEVLRATYSDFDGVSSGQYT